MKTKLLNLLLVGLTLMLGLNPLKVTAQGSCYTTSGCSDYGNFGYNSTGAATLEYDNYISTFHTSSARDIDGNIKIWGESSGSNGNSASAFLVPTIINPGNFPGLTGTPLKIAMASRDNSGQNILLTSDNKLWAWGTSRTMILDISLTTSTAFQQIGIDLPTGVFATDVKMIFAAYRVLAITTCDGSVYTLTYDNNNRGAGGTGSATAWSKVQKNTGGDLEDIIAVRGCSLGLIALDESGNLWTWGEVIDLGDPLSTVYTANSATQMTLPPETGTIKMIGMTGKKVVNVSGGVSTYYVLYENGNLYALGSNNFYQIGDWTNNYSTTWVQPRYPDATGLAAGAVMDDIKWISPNEHDDVHSAISIINNDKKVFNWGRESAYSLGRGVNGSVSSGTPVNPGEPINFEPGYSNSGIIAIEMGGHTSMFMKECVDNFGYIGHRINGSMGDNSAADITDNIVKFNTNAVQVCGVPTVTATLQPSVFGPYCIGNTITMIGSPAGGTYSILSSSTATASINATSGVLTFNTYGTLRVQYTVSDGVCGTTNINFLINVEACNDKVTIPGSVWNDVNGNAIINSGELGIQTHYWANLTDNHGNVVASVKIEDDGTFNFVIPISQIIAGDYKIALTSSYKNVGDNLSIGDNAPSGFFYTGTNHDGNANVSVTNINGILNIGALNTTSSSYTTSSFNFGLKEGTPTAIELVKFIAIAKNNTSILSWTTSSEQNNKGFEVEHSTSGLDWSNIGFVNTQTTNGNSQYIINYQFKDTKPSIGLNLYRLKQIDFDGKYTYSPVRQVKFSNENQISIYPNPAKDYVIVDGLEGDESIVIYDAMGRKIHTQTAENRAMTISTKDFQNGFYYFNITNENGKILISKFFVLK